MILTKDPGFQYQEQSHIYAAGMLIYVCTLWM